ncbi:hypothetical protein D3C83_19060 [compost metagenome]
MAGSISRISNMRAPETDARAKPLITSPTCRTGICSTVMNTRNCVSSPIVMPPCMTRSPPYHSTRPMAMK